MNSETKENKPLKIGIIGLGLIGGSFAKAYSENGHIVLGTDIDPSITEYAVLSKAISKELCDNDITSCDLILIAIPFKQTIKTIEKIAKIIAEENAEKDKTPIVMDCSGIKRHVCEKGFALGIEYGFTFIGGHPMAGSHRDGFKNSRGNLFKGATMIIVPPKRDDASLLEKAGSLIFPAGFKHINTTTAAEHDRMIALTSQLPHVVSNAFVKSKAAKNHKGFSAGSFRDLSRVAKLNPDMWGDLMAENKDNLLPELETLISSLGEYKTALENSDKQKLKSLLGEGGNLKNE